jgi:hypothetical protein
MPRGSRRIAVMGAVVAVVAALVASGPSTRASNTGSATFAGSSGTIARAASGQFSAQAAAPNGNGAQKDPFVTPAGRRSANSVNSPGSGPHGADAGLSKSGAGTVHNFTGLNSVDQFNAYGGAAHGGFVLEPPDQGLCTGTLAGFGSSVVVEIINDVVGFYTRSGTLVAGPFDLNTFFGENPALNVSDPRCLYDSTTQTWFFSAVIYTNDLFTDNHTDVLVLNGSSASKAVYSIDTRFNSNTAGGCPCFGDQPKIGIDNNNVYISVDQFNSPTTTDETGADLIALSKSQLVAESNTVNSAEFLNLSVGIGVTGLQPAITSSSPDNEYLLNSFPYLDEAQLHPNPSSTELGLWTLSDTDAVTEGGTPTLTESTITSQTYGFPVAALTTNGLSLATFTNDSRMQQVQYINGELWGALDSDVSVGGGTVDGAAWFEITPGGVVTDQGYVATAGEYLVYPAIVTTPGGATGIAFSITSPTLDPSTGYVLRKAGDTSFSSIHLTQTGSGPDIGFTCKAPFAGSPQQCRWGDYAWAALDPNGTDLWMAAELTVNKIATQHLHAAGFPPKLQTNWGTQVWDVSST